jgi:hypothetical protein
VEQAFRLAVMPLTGNGLAAEGIFRTAGRQDLPAKNTARDLSRACAPYTVMNATERYSIFIAAKRKQIVRLSEEIFWPVTAHWIVQISIL